METLLQADFAILNGIAAHFYHPFLDWLMPRITALGDYGLIWILLGVILLLLPRQRTTGGKILLALFLSLLFCNLILKNLVCRIRPFDLVEGITLLVPPPTDWSFPSGHTSASFAASLVLLRDGKPWGWAALVLALLIALSRLYLYVHYPSDVLAGALIGTGCGLLAHWLWSKGDLVKRGRLQ